MARSISVKIPTASLIASIEAKIAEIDSEIENYPVKRQQFEGDLEAYKNKIAEFVANYLSLNANKVSFEHDAVVRITNGMWNNKLEIQFDTDVLDLPKRPEEPKRPNQTSHYGREYTTQKSLLERNLKILRMTSQEDVSASTYGAVMELL